MATSGSYEYSVTAANVIQETLEQIGVLADGETVSANDQSICLRSLNMLVKQWSGNFDFAPGLKAFSRKIGYVFLQKNQGIYTLGPSGNHATLSYVQTTLSTDEIASSTSLGLTAFAGMSANDNIGIVLNDGTIHWTTISGTPGATTTIATGLASAASAGNVVFTYTTKLIRPLYMENVSIRDIDGNDTPMDLMTPDYYERIGVKGTDGTPTRYRYDDTLTNGTFYIDVEPDDVTNVIRLAFIAPAEDYDVSTNDIAYPQQWYLALALGLGKIVAPKFNSALWTPLHESNLQSALSIARTSYAETTEIYFQPGLE